MPCRVCWLRARYHSVPLWFHHSRVQIQLQHCGDSWVVACFPLFFFFNKGGSEFCCNCISNNYFGLSAGGSSQGSGSNKSAQSSWLECKWHSAVWAAERSPRSPFPPHARATRLPQPPHDGGQPRQHAVFGAVPLFPAKSCHPGKVIWKSASTSGSRSPSPRMCLCMPLTHALYHT